MSMWQFYWMNAARSFARTINPRLRRKKGSKLACNPVSADLWSPRAKLAVRTLATHVFMDPCLMFDVLVR